MVAVLAQPRLERRRIDAAPPVAGHDLDVESEPPRDLGPARANSPISNASTRSPGDSVLTSAASHAPVPDAGKITTGPEVWKMRFKPVEHLAAERGELGAPMIDRRLRHRAQHAIGHVGRTRDLEEVTAAPMHGADDRKSP